MAFFKRELGPVERFESALLARQDERRKLAARLDLTEKLLSEQRATAEKLAVSGASAAKLERAEAKMREVEERTRTLRTEHADLDAQIVATERALADARAQRDRELAADHIEALAAAIERAGPGFGAGASALVDAVTRGPAAVTEATKFAASVDAIRREVMSATDLICWELRTIAVRTRAGNANATPAAPAEAEHNAPTEIERQRIYTLNPLLWREGSEVCKAPAFTMVGLPKALLAVALRHQHVDYLNARRVQTLMHVHGSAQGDLPDDAALIDLDALAVEEQTKANVA
jgi:Trp operon repressor